MSFELMSTMGKRPWETFRFLEANLFVLHYVENSWEDVSPSKAGHGPTLPRITTPNRGAFQKGFLRRPGIRYLLISNQNKGPASIVRLARLLQICSEGNKIASQWEGSDMSLAPPRRVKPPAALPWEPGAALEGNGSHRSLPLTRKVTIWGNSRLKTEKCDARCFHVLAGLKEG